MTTEQGEGLIFLGYMIFPVGKGSTVPADFTMKWTCSMVWYHLKVNVLVNLLVTKLLQRQGTPINVPMRQKKGQSGFIIYEIS